MELLSRGGLAARSRPCRAGTTGLLIGLVAAWGAGCAGPVKSPPQGVDPDKLDDATFLAYLADEPLVSTAEACRAVLILADGKDTCASFEERRNKLIERGIYRPEWRLEPDQCVDKGTVAYMVAKVCGFVGGLNRILFGSWGLGDRRYAYRELVDRGLVQGGVDYQLITGGELAALLAKADAVMAERGLYPAPPADLGPPPGRQADRIAPPGKPSGPRGIEGRKRRP